jgi:hypothetical protein
MVAEVCRSQDGRLHVLFPSERSKFYWDVHFTGSEVVAEKLRNTTGYSVIDEDPQHTAEKLLQSPDRFPLTVINPMARRLLSSLLEEAEMPEITVSKSKAVVPVKEPKNPFPKPTKVEAVDKPEKATGGKVKEPKAPKAPKEPKPPKETDAIPRKFADPKQKIKVLVKQNPKREGTKSYERFGLYFTCKTVGEFLEAGGTRGDLLNDEAKGYIAEG